MSLVFRVTVQTDLLDRYRREYIPDTESEKMSYADILKQILDEQLETSPCDGVEVQTESSGR